MNMMQIHCGCVFNCCCWRLWMDKEIFSEEVCCYQCILQYQMTGSPCWKYNPLRHWTNRATWDRQDSITILSRMIVFHGNITNATVSHFVIVWILISLMISKNDIMISFMISLMISWYQKWYHDIISKTSGGGGG